MLSIPASIRIFMAREPIDCRKSHDGLLALVRDSFREDPFGPSLFVFLNRCRDRVKLLQWDRDGFWLQYKRLEEGAFRLPLSDDNAQAEPHGASFSKIPLSKLHESGVDALDRLLPGHGSATARSRGRFTFA